MTTFQLNPRVYAVVVDGDLVVLDVQADDYLCIPAGIEEYAVDGATGEVHCDVDLALDLEEAGLGSLSPRATYPREKPPSLPKRTIEFKPSVRMTIADLWLAFRAWRSIKRKGSVATLTKMKCPAPGRRDPVEASRIAAAHRLAMPLFPYVGECLFQARWLLEMLRRRGLDADWVFGVRAFPFSAHCWLQIDDVSLSDSPDYLLVYRPIMVVQ